MTMGSGTTSSTEPKHQARKKLEEWGGFIGRCAVIIGIIVIGVIGVFSCAAIAWGPNSTLASVLTVTIVASLAVVALVAVPFALVIWGIVKICEED